MLMNIRNDMPAARMAAVTLGDRSSRNRPAARLGPRLL